MAPQDRRSAQTPRPGSRRGRRTPRRPKDPGRQWPAPPGSQRHTPDGRGRRAHHEQSIPHRDPLAEGPKTTAGQEAELRQEPTEPPGRHPAHPPQGHGTPPTPGTQRHLP
uniref:basic salivary proline-rich protein 4-like n=1 Tax=Epinephelus lanceolatus TaxID=310571 RepID=UPI0014482CAE|nr:basic salivary proline-rich protein 4-like [Epinephelus lanceolatus]